MSNPDFIASWPCEWKARLRELREGPGCLSFRECGEVLSQEFAPRTFSKNACLGVAVRMGLKFDPPSPPMRYRDYLKVAT